MKRKLILFIFSFFLLLVSTVFSLTAKTAILYKLNEYNTFLQFNIDRTFNEIQVWSDKVQFDNYWFNLTGANLTFEDFFEGGKLKFSFTGPTGSNAKVSIYPSSFGKPKNVIIDGVTQTEGTSWSYNAGSNLISITYVLSSTIPVEVVWDSSTLLYYVSFLIRNTGTTDIDLTQITAYVDNELKNIQGNTGFLAPGEIRALNTTNVANPCGKKLTIIVGMITNSIIIAC